MKVLYDTNTLVAALVETHPHHPRALPWLLKSETKRRHRIDRDALTGGDLFDIDQASDSPKTSPSLAEKLILEDIIPNFKHFKRVYPAIAHVIEEPT